MFRELIPWPEDDWKPVSSAGAIAWLAFYALFLLYAFAKHGEFLFIDFANLIVHEGGHMLFGWFGPTMGVWGGTLLQWLVPALLAVYYFYQRQAYAFVFCAFFFFENMLYTATYMADARAQILPLVTIGDPEGSEHDWYNIFSSLDLLKYDTRIAAIVRFIGWAGMIGCSLWFVYRWQVDCAMQAQPLER